MVGESMKKVLIADDEMLVRIGLKLTIAWEEHGFIVVGEAKNGREAIELFEEFDPDILLTDIRMPIMNGLELIQELKSRKSSLKTVILSHYDDFKYAKEAIKLGASEYILKSDLSQENLLSVLSKLSDEIDSFNEENNKTDIGRRLEKSSNNNNLEKLFKRIVVGDYKSKVEMNSILNYIKNFFENGILVVAIMKIFINHFNDAVVSGLKDEDLKKSIENVSNQFFLENHIFKVLCFNEDEIIYLFNIEDTKEPKQAIVRVKKQVTLLKKNIKQFLDINVSIGLSGVGISYEKLPEVLNQAKIAQNCCFFEPSEIVVFDDDLEISEGECPKIHLDIIRGYLKTFDKEQLSNYINKIFDELIKIKNSSYIKEVFIDLLSYAKILAEELNLKNRPAFNEERLNYGNFEKLHNFVMAKKYITDIYLELMNHSDGNTSVRYSFVISKSLEYIKNNYNKNISLGDAADYVQISKSYLSLLFKQEMGINFSSYLTNYRIEKSKNLLLKSNCKIYEVAEKVGFDNPYYYSKVFKEVTGVSCKEFKKVKS